MRMRAGVLWSAVALALLAITSALRTTQVEGVPRTSRRLAVPSASDSNIVTSFAQDAAQPTFKSRGTRRHEETTSQSDIVRTRTRTRVGIPPTAQAQIQSTPKNERFDSRRTRTRSEPAPANLESNKDSTLTKETVIRSRSRGNIKRPTSTTTTPAPVELTSPAIDESKFEIINSNLDDITKIPTEAPTAATVANQFRRRNIPSTTESVTPQRSRGRINTRPNARSLDLTVSGTANTLTKAEKTPTTARSAADLRNSKKLRYRTRPSETDTNLTGEGLLSANEVIKSSQNQKSSASQEATPNTAPAVVETIIQQSTETNKPKTTTTKVTKVIKRPVPSRRNVNFRPSASLAPVLKVSDEISEDDNYPASFKALIQAKNASTQVSSPSSESLSSKGSQKVYKTYSTTSSQSTLTGPSTNKFSRWRNKQETEVTKVDNIVEGKIAETTPAPKESSSQTSEYKPRGTYTPRNRKSTFTPSSTQSISSSESSSEKPSFKYSRKIKVSTTELPKLDSVETKTVESSQTKKKPFVRPPFYSRKSKGRNEPKLVSSTEMTISGNRIRKESVKSLRRPTLPRTSFYTKTRNFKTKNEISSTIDPLKEETTESIIKKSEEVVETPFVFALLNNSEAIRVDRQPENKDNHMFLIAVTSKESLENTTSNEVRNTAEESENKPVVNVLPAVSTKQDSDRYKYHSNYKDKNFTNSNNNEKASSTVVPLVRNLQTRKYGRNRVKPVTNEDVVVTSPKTFRTVRKFSESFSKTTEASNNGITPEPEKTKTRFSSKYRASYLDKPFYKPTVPTITPSTAWLKFYVTDHLLTKSVEEPNWFEGDIYTTESMSRLNTTPYIHESSIEPVEGEEIQLGPDLNAISFTQTRRTLDSADLRLSESLVKPSHVMNVEASHHSPSVTISIFDALAEILTSTPRPRLSSTTEMTKIKSLNTDVKQVLNGVSNNVNVNSVRGLVSQDTFVLTNADVSTTTKTVQPTVQTPNVINSILVEGTATQSLNTEDRSSIPVNTLQTPIPSPAPSPNSTPTTPVSARKPFAIRILYSDTESPTDKITTASPPTQGSTDNPKTVYNSVSDLLLSNNNLVSSELTSMLSNNIKNIIENMDENSRSKLNTVDMNKFLRTLIPRALDGLATALDNADTIPDTTPYSLDDIKDTENIVIDGIESNNVVQNVVSDSSVNNTVVDRNVKTTVTPIPADVNSPVATGTIASPSSESNRQVTTAATSTTVKILPSSQGPSSEATSTTLNFETATSPASLDTDTFKINDTTINDTINDKISSNSTNNFVPVPFLTNFRNADFTNDDDNENTSSTIANPLSLLSSRVSSPQDVESQIPNKISPLQLWVLSKKAQVLKMIEDLIRQHNTELATAPPLTDLVRSSDTVNLSDRFSDIVNTMISSTSTETLMTRDIESTSPMTTESFTINPLSTASIETTMSGKPDISLTTNPTETTGTVVNVDVSTTTEPFTSISSRSESFENNSGSTTLSSGTTVTNTASFDTFTSTFEPTTDGKVVEVLSRLQDGTATTTPTTTAEATTTSTAATTTETTTQATIETSTINVDITTAEASDSNTIPTTINTLNIGSSIIPKKDYVIFGILPNNTVVRKDPNQDILETLTEASPYIVYGILPNNTVIRKFPNGTRVPRVMQKIDILPISPWSLRNPYSPIHNNPAIVRPQSNPIRVSTNTVTSTDTSNNGTERLTNDTVNNQQTMISTSALNIKSSNGITTTFMPEKSTASHVLSLRTTTMLPSIDEILLNSISSAAKQDMVISEMTSSTREPRILTLDIDPETKQIRTEKPGEGDTSAVFKFIPIDEIMVQTQESNVLKLSSTKAPQTKSGQSQVQTLVATSVTEMNTQTPQIQTQETTTEATTFQITTSIVPETTVVSSAFTNRPATPETTTLPFTTTIISEPITTTTTTTTTPAPTTTTSVPTTTPTTPAPVTTVPTTIQTTVSTQTPTTTQVPTTMLPLSTLSIEEEIRRYQADVQLLKTLLQATGRDPKSLNLNQNLFSLGDLTSTTAPTTTTQQTTTTTESTTTTQQNDAAKLLQALITNLNNPTTLSAPRVTTKQQVTTTARSIEDDIKQFEEDTKFLQALLQATGQNPANLNIPSLDSLTTTRTFTTNTQTIPTTTFRPTTTTVRPTTTATVSTTQSIEDDLRQYQEDTKLLQALLQATGQNPQNLNIPIVSGVTSNVRIASNPQTTSLGSNPTTPLNIRPVYTTTNSPIFKTFAPRTVVPTLQPTTENVKISTTFQPINQRRQPTTTARGALTTLAGRRAPGFTSTTELPSTSTFSVEEDLAFLKNLKTVLNTNPKNDDPEAALANRIIALAVEKSLNEIQTGKPDATRTGKNIAVSPNNLIPLTTIRPTTTTRTTTTTRPPTTTTTTTTTTLRPTTTQRITSTVNSPSLDDDIRQFQEDTKLLQALLKATGQDPSKLNLPTLPPNINVSQKELNTVNEDLKLLSNLLASPSPLNEPFDPLTPRPLMNFNKENVRSTVAATSLPYGAKIAVKDNLKSVQDDKKLLQTLIKLQDVQETTTQRIKLTITGQSADEALKKLVRQQKPTGMVSEATQTPISLSTEYGKSNDALLAALLKEQGFGPTTASSLDEQLRLSALLNQVVVTPKARRTTTPPPPPPPPAPRRPILDGLAWLWQQWRETAPGSGPPRPNRRPASAPAPSARPSMSATATSNGASWLGSGPFVGNADDAPANRIPLEPPRSVASEQTPGRGQLVSAAINVTRAFSQFLGAAIQGAAQTVQSVFRAGQRAASDVYVNGSGGSG